MFFSGIGIYSQSINQQIEKVCFDNGKCFSLEVCRSHSERGKGLMFKESLDRESGMLFIYEKEGFHSMWMKNMRFPIDIIWIDANRQVVDIARNLKPCKSDYECQGTKTKNKALYVLEINAGVADEIGVKVGDSVFFH